MPLITPNNSDVLCGRGGQTFSHPGNKNYRQIIIQNKVIFFLKTKMLKLNLFCTKIPSRSDMRYAERRIKLRYRKRSYTQLGAVVTRHYPTLGIEIYLVGFLNLIWTVPNGKNLARREQLLK